MRRFIVGVILLASFSTQTGQVRADGKSKAAMEVAEYVLQRFGRKAVQEGTEALARRIEVAAARHGPEVLTAVRRVGPRALYLLEEAGAHSGKAAQILAKHGEAGAVWVVSRPAAMNLVVRHGEGAASALVKHAGGAAEPLIERFGAPAVRALQAAGPQSGRRLAMMMADGQLAKIGRSEELLEVIARYGDRGATFIWEHKGVLVGGAVLTAFLANPEPYLNGTKELIATVGESVVKPTMDSVVKPAVSGVLTVVYLTLGFLAILIVSGGLLAHKYGLPRPEQLKLMLAMFKR